MTRPAAPKFYAIRQARTKVIGSRAMTQAEAEYEAKVWRGGIGPAVAVPVTPELRRAVAAYDQEVLVPLLAGATVTA